MASRHIEMVDYFRRCFNVRVIIPMKYAEHYDGQLFISSVFE